tara:strand:- start:7 stop:639 length:633 start_codon:yes stop_codon:yes gene_type:complete
MELTIQYLRKEYYIGKAVSGHNCDFEYSDAEFERFVLMCLDQDNRKCTITLYHTEGECGSGWTIATWGNFDFEYVDSFGGYTHKPVGKLKIDFNPNKNNHENDVFNVKYDGGDVYYPCGGFTINLSLFVSLPRKIDVRPTFIWKGSSGIGKSFLANRFKDDVVVFETDAFDTLPENIVADVVVLGNKHSYTVEDITNRLTNTKPVVCDFQ